MRIFGWSNFEKTHFLCVKNGQISQKTRKKRVYNENKEFKDLRLIWKVSSTYVWYYTTKWENLIEEILRNLNFSMSLVEDM